MLLIDFKQKNLLSIFSGILVKSKFFFQFVSDFSYYFVFCINILSSILSKFGNIAVHPCQLM